MHTARRCVTSEEQAAETHHGFSLPNSLRGSPQSVMGSVGCSAGSVSGSAGQGRPLHSCAGDHSCVGRCFKTPRMGQRIGSAGIQVTALIQFFQSGNLNHLAGEE